MLYFSVDFFGKNFESQSDLDYLIMPIPVYKSGDADKCISINRHPFLVTEKGATYG